MRMRKRIVTRRAYWIEFDREQIRVCENVKNVFQHIFQNKKLKDSGSCSKLRHHENDPVTCVAGIWWLSS